MAKRWLSRDIGLYRGTPQVENFKDLVSIYPVRVVRRSRTPESLRSDTSRPLPDTYEFSGAQRSTTDLLEQTATTGLLVLKDERVVHESYAGGVTSTTPWPCWSVTKSFVSTLVGIALDKGIITSTDDIVSDLAPNLAGSGYSGVRLHDVLTMSSGARWYENYADPDSDTRRHGLVHATGGSLDEFTATLPREWPPGTRMRYNSIDTNVLGLLLRRSARKALAALLHEWLWSPLGAEHEAYFTIDGEGHEWAGAGLMCTLRDRARLGLLFANGGAWNGRRIVSAEWVEAATSASAPHLTCEGCSASPFGYGYQWWLQAGAFCAIGIYNQYVWVDPTRRVVIAKLSATPTFGQSFDEAGYRDQEHMAFFRAIASTLLA